jgi:LysR family transcriptional regulator, nitrogen assimilation regulatory protein
MKRSRIQLRHLNYFIKIVEAGSFSRAAALIHVAQPALSQQITELEEILGIALLHRSARGIRPTAAGELLLAEAKVITDRIEHLPEVIRASGEEITGLVRIGISQVLASLLEGAIADVCKAALPKVTLHMVRSTSESLTRRVREHSLDIALVFDGEFVKDVASQALFSQQLFLISQRARFAERDSISREELREMSLVLPARPHPDIAEALVDPLSGRTSLAHGIFIEDDFSALLSAVQAGIGNTVMAIGDVSHEPGGSLMKAVPIEPPIYMTVCHVTPIEPAPPPAADAVSRAILNLISRYLEEQRMIGAMAVAS